jgi:hypothetical protein
MINPMTAEVLVAGGGPAGLGAAISAARSGAKVVLVQDRPVLGGNASSEIRMHIVGADGILAERSRELSVEAREGGLIEEIRLDACVTNPQLSPSVFDLILYDKCKREPNLTLLLNTTVTDVKMEENRIHSVIASRPSTEDTFVITAPLFIDCTGDGFLGAKAGADFRQGREASAEFDESLAHPVADGKTLGSTLLFMARRHDRPMPFTAPSWARKFTEEDLRHRPHAKPGFESGLEYGYWWIEWGGELDTIRDNEKIRDELLAILLGVWDHIKNSGDHGAENWALDWCGLVPGKRESRRFLGPVILTEHDILGGKPWADAIAYGGWPIDTHPPGGVDATDEKPCTQIPVPKLYDIPLRACFSKNIPNLLFAGRNISATHIAFASTRVMATCCVVGQGVGTAAAMCARRGLDPPALVADAEALSALRQQLLRDDCFLIGVHNEEENDLARKASLSATSSRDGFPPAAVTSGVTRCVHGDGGVAPERCLQGPHRWMSAPELPASLLLEWPAAVTIGCIQITFDTGLHRLLTFSLAQGVQSRMQWGQAPPETVRDYWIEAKDGPNWRTLFSVSGNYQRMRRHVLSTTVSSNALRITALATNGEPSARIVEVRVYPPGTLISEL